MSRENGLDEIVECYEDVYFIMNKVEKMNWLKRKKFSRIGQIETNKLDDPYLICIPEYMLEVYNCAYEKLIESDKLPYLR